MLIKTSPVWDQNVYCLMSEPEILTTLSLPFNTYIPFNPFRPWSVSYNSIGQLDNNMRKWTSNPIRKWVQYDFGISNIVLMGNDGIKALVTVESIYGSKLSIFEHF